MLWWEYPDRLMPMLPNYFPIDYVLIPVIFMLVYQKFSGWKAFIWASLLMAAFLSLIADPVLVWLNLYQPLTWQYHYGIPVFVLTVIIARAVTGIVVFRNESSLSDRIEPD